MVGRVGVIGGGAMGAGIALEFAVGGYEVVVLTRSTETGAAALDRIRRDLGLMVDTGLLGQGEAEAAAGRIRPTTVLAEAVRRCDHVVESVPEDLPLKQEVFAELDAVAPAEVLLASNTTSLPVSAIAAKCGRPERVLSTHYYLPAHLVPLVDVVPGEHTDPEAVERACGLLAELGKSPVAFGVDAGATVGPRLQTALLAEAMKLLAEGVADARTIDKVITEGIGRRLGVTGVFDRLDLAGLDTIAAVLRAQGKPVPAVLAEKLDRGELGRKSGRGFYSWSPPEAAAFEERVARHLIAQLEADRAVKPSEPPAVLVDREVLEPFLAAAIAEYRMCTPAEPPRCFALLVGEQRPDAMAVRQLHFAGNVRDDDPDVEAEFVEHIVPCFGAAYANKRRGFWADGTDVLRTHRAAQAAGLELLGSIHLHPDWHRIGPPAERNLRISHRPTPMDAYLFANTGWPLNLICYLERIDGTIYSTLGAWGPPRPGSPGRECVELPIRYAHADVVPVPPSGQP